MQDINEMKFADVIALKKQFEDMNLVSSSGSSPETGNEAGLCSQIGEKVLVRTYSAGVWYGTLTEKYKNEIYLENARRLWEFECNEGIEISDISLNGIRSDSRIGPPVSKLWIQPIEIHTTTTKCQSDLESAPNATRS